jgi:hypothetical protein
MISLGYLATPSTSTLDIADLPEEEVNKVPDPRTLAEQ